VARVLAANPAPEVGKRSGCKGKAYHLLVRLDGQRADVLRFITDFNVPFRQLCRCSDYADVCVKALARG
jgi:hypothetical protein